jgi:hypothetical protein
MRGAASGLLLLLCLSVAAVDVRAQADAASASKGAAASDAAPAAKDASASRKSLFELLDLVQKGLEVESEENIRREREFVKARADQERLLAEARATLAQKEKLSQELEQSYWTVTSSRSGVGPPILSFASVSPRGEGSTARFRGRSTRPRAL